MKLNRRECDIRIRLTPCSADFQKVQWSIGGDHHTLWPSAVMAGQFSCLLSAVYRLYDEASPEASLSHGHVGRIRPNKGRNPKPYWQIFTRFQWDEEGRIVSVALKRRSYEKGEEGADEDLIDIELDTPYGKYEYTVKGKDLCYAVAKACTETVKKYGFKGYCWSSDDGRRNGECIDINELLFVKAYALDAMDVRELRLLWRDPNGWMEARGSSLEKELELLLFDM